MVYELIEKGDISIYTCYQQWLSGQLVQNIKIMSNKCHRWWMISQVEPFLSS